MKRNIPLKIEGVDYLVNNYDHVDRADIVEHLGLDSLEDLTYVVGCLRKNGVPIPRRTRKSFWKNLADTWRNR